ncbi:unnamed protein product, partial [Didymodactylos carnosus]
AARKGLKWSAHTDPLARTVLEESAGNATYLSHHIQNELINIMANQIRDSIAERLRDNVYVLLADEATDVSHNKQLSICLRLVDDQYQINEFFMKFVRLYRFDAATLAKEINTTSVLKRWAITKWDSRFKSIDSIKSNFSAITQALQDLIHDGGGRAVDARECAQFNPQRRKSPGHLKPIPAPSGVWHLLTMDFHGPVSPQLKRGKRHIISITHVLSKFVVAKAVRDCSAQTAVCFLKEEVITQYDTPKCILTDNGSHFTALLMDELFKQF